MLKVLDFAFITNDKKAKVSGSTPPTKIKSLKGLTLKITKNIGDPFEF